MDAVIKRRIIKDVTVLWIALIALAIVVWVPIVYFASADNIFSVLLPAKKITAGEDLSGYEGKKVSCRIHCVGGYVVQYYSNSDPYRSIYACGYMALDDQLKNPFCVFVPTRLEGRMETLLNKTWDRRNGITDANTDENFYVEVNGVVRKLNSDERQYFVEAVQYFYENNKPRYGDVYYIDGGNVMGKHQGDTKLLLLELCFIFFYVAMAVILAVYTVKAFQYPKVIEEFLLQSRMSKSQLETAFQSAEEVYKGIWISPEITVFFEIRGFGIVRNRDLVWAYVIMERGYKGSRKYYLELYDKNKNRCGHIGVNHKYQPVLDYYEKYCTHIVIGLDEEKQRLFDFAFDKFLRLRYYWNMDLREEEFSRGFGAGYNSDLSGYQNLIFEEDNFK
ncbi:MAG: hypothetical protein K5739_02820 [Lachnospiraceae bacterium]|nr:hypothetical protein [Lachnospiraceae bacterium]